NDAMIKAEISIYEHDDRYVVHEADHDALTDQVLDRRRILPSCAVDLGAGQRRQEEGNDEQRRFQVVLARRCTSVKLEALQIMRDEAQTEVGLSRGEKVPMCGAEWEWRVEGARVK